MPISSIILPIRLLPDRNRDDEDILELEYIEGEKSHR